MGNTACVEQASVHLGDGWMNCLLCEKSGKDFVCIEFYRPDDRRPSASALIPIESNERLLAALSAECGSGQFSIDGDMEFGVLARSYGNHMLFILRVGRIFIGITETQSICLEFAIKRIIADHAIVEHNMDKLAGKGEGNE